MSSNTVSAVLEKLIRLLCLTDFPCGRGSWRKSTGGIEGAETEDTDALLDLLNCPHSPWHHEVSWSPQASGLREVAVLSPERLHKDFIYKYFKTLHIVDKGVSVVDKGLLKFSKLEDLVLSANKISEVPADNLPRTLKVLELHANWLPHLISLNSDKHPHLQHLGLSSNPLGHNGDSSNLSGRHWPQLVCLDLGDCEFQEQKALLGDLKTLPCLKRLVLEGNPFTLAPSYPGLTVDSLPQLSCLDTTWISFEQQQCFRGLAKMSDLIVDQVSATVTVGRVKGIPDPLRSGNEKATDFPVVTYSYFVSYEFFSHQSTKVDNDLSFDSTHVAEDNSSDTDPQSDRKCQIEKSEPETHGHVSRYSTCQLVWSEIMDFSDTRVHIIRDLAGLKKFLKGGFYLRIEEEKVLSWPAAAEDLPGAKPGQKVKERKGGKGRDSPIKSGSTKEKSKDKKKKSVPELVQDAPIRRNLGSVHVPLQSLIKVHKLHVICEAEILHTESEVKAAHETPQDLGKKIKEDKRKEDTESKRRGGSSAGQKHGTVWSKGKGEGGRDYDEDAHADNTVSVPLMTVEFSVELEKWHSASEAHQRLMFSQQMS
ncbi:hypothetical protein JOB18_008184 [Solea senegalensis]|uniref:Leucine-rich repeat-containing protein 43 n=1 Tax=Solea senegalensis TaxID=28829 RepID=A0AAV6QFH9_SOLSE|nr:hypothetical protein JOB18_008184 [Solea senegalensis]